MELVSLQQWQTAHQNALWLDNGPKKLHITQTNMIYTSTFLQKKNKFSYCINTSSTSISNSYILNSFIYSILKKCSTTARTLYKNLQLQKQ